MYTKRNGKIPFPRLFFSIMKNFAHLDVKIEAWQHQSAMLKHFDMIPDRCVLFYFVYTLRYIYV